MHEISKGQYTWEAVMALLAQLVSGGNVACVRSTISIQSQLKWELIESKGVAKEFVTHNNGNMVCRSIVYCMYSELLKEKGGILCWHLCV